MGKIKSIQMIPTRLVKIVYTDIRKIIVHLRHAQTQTTADIGKINPTHILDITKDTKVISWH